MFNFFKRKRKRLLGLDIGSYAVKLLELSRTHDQYCVEHYAVLPITQTIAEARIQSGSALRSAAIAMPDSSVISKIVPIRPGFSTDQIEEMILLDAEKYIPYPLSEINLDFDVLDSEVLLVAAHTTQVNARTALAEAASLMISVVDVQSYAIERACSLLHPPLESTLAIIDIGHSTISMTVLHQRKIIFSRMESLGNREASIAPVQRAFQFFFSAANYKEVTHVLLTGGGSYTTDLCTSFEKQLGIPASIANPFADMCFAPHINKTAFLQEAPLLVTSCGLALRSFDP
jgi:type IV pilus assembly protein PilM